MVLVESSETQEDFQLARETMKDVIVKGKEALQEAVDLAKNLGHPMGFQSIGPIIKALSDASVQLLEIQQRIRDIEEQDIFLENPEEQEDPAKTGKNITHIENAQIFTGTTAELLAGIRGTPANPIEISGSAEIVQKETPDAAGT